MSFSLNSLTVKVVNTLNAERDFITNLRKVKFKTLSIIIIQELWDALFNMKEVCFHSISLKR